MVTSSAGIKGALLVAGFFYFSGCASSGPHRLQTSRLEETRLGKQMEFAVLRAPVVDGVDPRDLPVFVLLHGMGGDHLDLDRTGLSDRLLKAMLDGEIPMAHFVLPDGEDGYYVNWYDGTRPYEDYIIHDVIPAAEDVLGVSPDRDHRHIIGVSMGGQGALRLGLTHPDLFGSASSLSSLVLDREQANKMMQSRLFRLMTDVEDAFGDGTDDDFSDSQNAYKLVEQRPEELHQKLFLAAGSDEWAKFAETSMAFSKHLAMIGVDHKFVLYNGGHGWEDWFPVIEKAMNYAVE